MNAVVAYKIDSECSLNVVASKQEKPSDDDKNIMSKRKTKMILI